MGDNSLRGGIHHADAGVLLAGLEGVDHAVDIDIECGLAGVINGLAGALLRGRVGEVHEPAGSAAAVELEDDALKALVLADAHVGHREFGGRLRPEGLHLHIGLAQRIELGAIHGRSHGGAVRLLGGAAAERSSDEKRCGETDFQHVP